MRASAGRLYPFNAVLVLASVLGALSLITGCASFTINNPAAFTALSAPSTTIRVNQQIQFSSSVLSIKSPVTFRVNGILGGNSDVGTINSAGLYVAPAVVPVPNAVVITGAADNYPSYPTGSFTLSVWNPIPILSAVTPSGFSEGTETITVTGSQFVYGAQILWDGVAVPTTLVSDSQLVASVSAPLPGSFPLLVSNPNPGSANSATIPVLVGPGQVVLTLQSDVYSVRVSNQLNLPLQVNGTNNTGVTLLVNGIAGGNPQVGTAVSNQDGSITYTAPPVLPSPSNIVQLTVTSVDNPKVFLNQNIAVLNPIPILLSATPMSLDIGPPSTTVVLTGQDFISGAQLLVNGAPVAGTVANNGTQLTASISPTEAGNLDLQVLNPSPGPAASTDLIALVNGTPPTLLVAPDDASRFLQQATFGATDGAIHHLSMIGFQPWLTEQFGMTPTPQEPAVEQAIVTYNPPCAAGDVICNAALFEQNNLDEIYVQDTFWQQSLTAPDQLRQRVAFALSELFVISSESNFTVQSMPRGEAQYYDVLAKDSFGNFRNLLQDVTLNPMMGLALSMLNNDKGNATTDPDENYAREVMQLFTVGLYQLSDDGSQRLDATGNPIPTYSNTDVMGLAAVFTGFSWNNPNDTSEAAWGNCCAYVGPGFGEEILPMQSYPQHHSVVQKNFLGVTIPATSVPDPNGDLKIALDTLFNHPNLPPFFCKQMIQHLVTSNPSPTYIGNCSAVFKDDGTGVRGNLQAVISEILLDPEARNSATDFANPQYGKVREATLRYTEWARAFTAQSRSGSYNLGSTEDPIYGLGEMWMRSPTVFNWFAPGYVPPGTSIAAAGLVAPEMEMTDVTTVVGYLNFMQNAIGSSATAGPDIFSDYDTERNLAAAASPTALVDRIDLLLMAGEMDTTLYGQILTAVSSIPIPTGNQAATNAALANRVEAAIYLTMASPSFCAQF